MINRLIITTTMSVWAGTAFAASPVVWVGGFLIQAATPQVACDAVNAQQNELYTAVFHPKLAGDATVARDVMQILQHQKATRVSPTTVNFAANGNYTGTIWTGRALNKNFNGTYSSFVVNTVPAGPLTAATVFVNITGKIQNYGAPASGCEITFAASLTRKP